MLGMAKTTAPLLGFGAAGQIGKAQVYASWKGRGYARRYVIPANPKSVSQMQTRNVFSFLMAMWKTATADFQAPWTAFASGQALTNRNALAKFNVKNLRTATDLHLLTFSPGAKGGIAPASIGITAGASQLTVALGTPVIPAGWAIVAGVAAAVKSQDPHSGTAFTVFSATDLVTPYAPIITGLTTGTLYDVGGWFVWTKPDLTTAYGTSLQATGTPT
jgi:hypothetical protein